MAPSAEATQKGYRALWTKAFISPERVTQADAIAAKAIANRPLYEDVSKRTGVPWFVLAAIHTRESSMDFRGVLHNGQKIIGTGRKTTLVPKGRGPFNSWGEAAVDALASHGLDKVQRWSLERCLFEMERWNGWGYLGRINSPYVWSWTDLYDRGKFVADGRYDPNHIDQQPGCAAILKALAKKDPAVAAALLDSEPAPRDVIKKATQDATRNERAVAGGAGTGAVAAGGAKLGTEVPASAGPSFVHAYVLPLGIAVLIAVTIVAVVRMRQKAEAIRRLWS